MENRVCKKCLIWDEMPKNMTDYLKTHADAIPEEERTAPSVLESRLQICDSCDKLTEGICRACGCYAYLRASAKRQRCPYKKWSEARIV